MSRIEEALEKAAKLRSGERVAQYTDKPTPVPTPIQLPPATERLKVTNRLLVAECDQHTPVAEEYRKLKSVIVKLTREGEFRNLLMVTSSVGNEGKSITSLNLAMALAQEYDHTVLLIDADLRKPSLHNYLGIEQKEGLSECLLEGRPLNETIVRTGIGRLSLLPAGRQVKNPTELFSSQRSKDFFVELKHRYSDRYVIIDTPPILPFAEARSLSTIVDGVLLVVKEGVVSLRDINETIDCLKGSSVLGIVYNDAKIKNRHDHYHYYREAQASA